MRNSYLRQLALLLLLIPLSTVASQPLEKISLQLKWKHEFQFAGFYMAKKLGYYREAGLDVEIREAGTHTHPVEEVLSGRATYGVSDSALVYERLNGKPVVALAAIFQHSPMALMTLKSSGIESPSDLLGKRVMTFSTEKNISLLATLMKEGVALSEVEMVPHSFDVNDLINKKVDAYAVYTSDQPFQLREQGVDYHLIDPAAYGFDFYGDILFTDEEELGHERTDRFVKASLRGWRYALDHVDETIDIIFKHYNSLNRSRKLLRFEADVLKKLAETKSAPLGSISRERINSIAYIYNLINREPGSQGVKDTKTILSTFIFQEGKAYITQKERDFLNKVKVNIITTANWEPFNLTDENDQLEGIAIDYWKLISRNADLRSHTTIAGDWGEVLESIKAKAADATLSTISTNERRGFALFSKPYAHFPVAIATTNDKGFISDGYSLNNRKVSVGKGFSAHETMKKHFPDVELVAVKNIEEALDLLSRGEVFATVDILPVLTYSIAKFGHTNLKIAGTTGEDCSISIMVRDDYPELVSIINKSIDAITEDEKKVIFNKWVPVNYQRGIDYSLLWKLGLPLLLLLIIFSIWNKRLHREVESRKAAEKKYELLASTDKLTNISNRYKIDILLTQQINISLRYHHPLSIIFIDLDGFKVINDTYGHKSGDSVLIEFAQLLQGQIRKSDYLGRWGGEEFMVILPETPQDQALILAEKLRHYVETYQFHIIEHLTCSSGVTQLNKNDSSESMVARVDKALYAAKDSGKNRVVAA